MSRHRPISSIHSASRSSPNKPPQQPISLAKRLLFPTLTTNALPPLLATPSTPPELTAELYDFIALALRAFVNPWWTKITRYDKEFLPEITRIVTVVIRSLEERVLATDLSPLVYHDIPIIITQHYTDYRNAASKLSTSYASGGALSLPQLFHQLQPHMAVSADGKINEEYFRQIIDHILKACLPPEDYAPEAERFIVREVILKVIVNDVLPKIIQPWFIQKTILDLLGPPPEPAALKQPKADQPNHSSSFSFHTIIVMVLSAIQFVSGGGLALIHAYKQAMNTIKLVNKSSHKPDSPSCSPKPPSLSPNLPSRSPSAASIPQSTFSLPLSDPLSVSRSASVASSTSSRPKSPVLPATFPTPAMPTDDIPTKDTQIHDLYAYPPLLMISAIFMMNDRFASSTILNTAIMLSSCFPVFLDHLLPYLLANFLSPAFLLNTLRTAKRTLFPNGYPGPTPIEPTPEEQAQLRASLVAWRGKGAVSHFLPFILGPDPSATLGTALDPLTSAPCNVHLVVMILDRVMVSLFPELLGSTAIG